MISASVADLGIALLQSTIENAISQVYSTECDYSGMEYADIFLIYSFFNSNRLRWGIEKVAEMQLLRWPKPTEGVQK